MIKIENVLNDNTNIIIQIINIPNNNDDLMKLYPDAYNASMKYYKCFKRFGYDMFGEIQFIKIDKNKYIVNFYCISEDNILNYSEFRFSIAKLHLSIENIGLKNPLISIQNNIGCEHFMIQWNQISDIIQNELSDKYNISIYNKLF